MDIACGTDIIEISRIKDSFLGDSGEKFKERVFTEVEINYCESKNENKYQHYAARFAAKEAIFKAISSKLDSKYSIEWKQIEVNNNTDGKPLVNINHEANKYIKCIDISLSHCKEYATANAVVVFDK